MGKYIIDISHYHPITNWKKAKEQCSVLICKATEGTHFVDSTLKDFVKSCEKYQIPYFLYGFLRMNKELDSAKYLVKTCKDLVGPYFVGYGLDIENALDGSTPTVAGAKKAVDYINSLGGKVLIYTGYGQYDLYKPIIKALPDNCVWWEARYPKKDSQKPHNCDLWQYYDKFKTDFASGGVDINRIMPNSNKKLEWYTTPIVAKNETTTTEKGDNMTYSREEFKKVLLSWEGKKESNGTHKSIIDLYNKHSPLPRGYKVKYTDSWCMTTLAAAAIKLGYTAIIPIECSCNEAIKLAKKMGIWVEDDAYVPNISDFVLYDWDDNGKGDCTGFPEHVGSVIAVNKKAGTFEVIEGNYKDSVKRRTMQINGRYIRGFICPKYTTDVDVVKAETVIATPKKKYSGEIPELPTGTRQFYKYGDGMYAMMAKKDEIKKIQKFLNWYINAGLTVDGEYGTNTRNAVISFQRKSGIKTDGIFGKDSLSKLKTVAK